MHIHIHCIIYIKPKGKCYITECFKRSEIKVNVVGCLWKEISGIIPQCPSVYMLRHTFSWVPQLWKCNLFASFHIPLKNNTLAHYLHCFVWIQIEISTPEYVQVHSLTVTHFFNLLAFSNLFLQSWHFIVNVSCQHLSSFSWKRSIVLKSKQSMILIKN